MFLIGTICYCMQQPFSLIIPCAMSAVKIEKEQGVCVCVYWYYMKQFVNIYTRTPMNGRRSRCRVDTRKPLFTPYHAGDDKAVMLSIWPVGPKRLTEIDLTPRNTSVVTTTASTTSSSGYKSSDLINLVPYKIDRGNCTALTNTTHSRAIFYKNQLFRAFWMFSRNTKQSPRGCGDTHFLQSFLNVCWPEIP